MWIAYLFLLSYLYHIYPARVPSSNSTEYKNLTEIFQNYVTYGYGRSALLQGTYQVIAVGHTIFIALLFGIITGM